MTKFNELVNKSTSLTDIEKAQKFTELLVSLEKAGLGGDIALAKVLIDALKEEGDVSTKEVESKVTISETSNEVLIIKVGELYFKGYDDDRAIVLTKKIDDAYTARLNSNDYSFKLKIESLKENGMNPQVFKKIEYGKVDIVETDLPEDKELEFI